MEAGGRSPFSPRAHTPMRRAALNRSVRSQQTVEQQHGEVVYKTSHMTLETTGQLPVTVTEVLAYGGSAVSVGMSSCGWSWAVCGRRALVWQHAGGAGVAARELTLPQTDLPHRAELLLVRLEEPGDAAPACVAVSPEGTVRYWRSVARETAFHELPVELQGQECARLAAGDDDGELLLATTTCGLVALEARGGRLVARALRPAGGLLRRVSLMLWGAAAGPPRLDAVCALPGGGAALLAGPLLQLWDAAGRLHEHELRRVLAPAPEPDARVVHAAALPARRLALLLCSSGALREGRIRAALAVLCVAEPSTPRVLRLAGGEWREPAPAPAPRLLPMPGALLMYTPRTLALLHATELRVLDLMPDGDRVLAAAPAHNAQCALIFTCKHGALLLSCRDDRDGSSCESPMSLPADAAPASFEGNLSLYELDPRELEPHAGDALGHLKTALLYHVRRDLPAVRRVLAAAFPEPGGDSALRDAVAHLAEEMVDDAPAGDPRWDPTPTRAGPALGASGALRPGAQLADKRRALALLDGLLIAAGLRQRLDGAARARVGRAHECLAAAQSLHTALMAGDAAVQRAVETTASREERRAGLAPADLVFRHVSRIGRVLAALCRHTEGLPALLAALGASRTERHNGDGNGESIPPWSVELLPDMLRLHRALSQPAPPLAELALEDARLLPPEKFAEMRGLFITPFVDAHQEEVAISLAEKFQDFPLLIELCVRGGHYSRLAQYMGMYEQEGLCEAAFRWLTERGGPERAALVRKLGPLLPERLSGWLQRCEVRSELLAAHELAAGRHDQAARALTDLARMERTDVRRLRNAASLAKLCLAVKGQSDPQLDRLLALADHHAMAPGWLRRRHALRGVLTPGRLGLLYTDAGEHKPSEQELRRALHLADLVDFDDQYGEDGEHVRLKVWSCAVLQDPLVLMTDSELRNTMLSKLVRGVVEDGGQLPPLEDLLAAPDLQDLPRDLLACRLAYVYQDVENNTSDD